MISVEKFVELLNDFAHSCCVKSCEDCKIYADYEINCEELSICSHLCGINEKLNSEFKRVNELKTNDFIEIIENFYNEGDKDFNIDCDSMICDKCILYNTTYEGERICKVLVDINIKLNE